MVRLREIPRTATFAWSPGPTQPLIATGTKAGAVDADFSNDTTLELWELNLDSEGQAIELQPVATVHADSRHVPLNARRQSLYLDRVLTRTPDSMT